MWRNGSVWVKKGRLNCLNPHRYISYVRNKGLWLKHDQAERSAYFRPLIETLQTPPTTFPDALPRKPRQLEILPLAPPLPPRQPTEAELQRELERDRNARDMMVLSFTSLVQEFLKKFRKVVATVRVSDDSHFAQNTVMTLL